MKITYKESLVVFIDILGFSNIVYNKDKSHIEEYFSYIQSEFKRYLLESKFQYLLISDSIVISSKKNKENLSELIFLTAKIQYQLFLKGILLRGGISFGQLYINKSKNIIVGPGLINAYKLESSAKYPRVVIDRQIIQEFFTSTLEFSEYLNSKFSALYGETDEKVKFDNRLNDGKPYVNYMRKVVRYGTTYQNNNIEKIVSFFSRNYFQNEFYEKYNWLLEELKAELSLALLHYKEHPEIGKAKYRIDKIEMFLGKLKVM